MSNLYYDLPIELQRKIELLRPTHPLAKLIQDAMIISPADIYAEFDGEEICEFEGRSVVVADIPLSKVQEAIDHEQKAEGEERIRWFPLLYRLTHMEDIYYHIHSELMIWGRRYAPVLIADEQYGPPPRSTEELLEEIGRLQDIVDQYAQKYGSLS